LEHVKGTFYLNELLNCRYRYKFLKEIHKGEGIVLSLNKEGFIFLAKEFLSPKKIMEVMIDKPLGPLTVKVEVDSCKMEWYITDKKKELYFTTQVMFKDLSYSDKARIIRYISDCKAERRKARLRRLKFR